VTAAVGGALCALLVLAIVGREALDLGAIEGRATARRALNASIVVLGGLLAVVVGWHLATLT
jgi:hypothetical protein